MKIIIMLNQISLNHQDLSKGFNLTNFSNFFLESLLQLSDFQRLFYIQPQWNDSELSFKMIKKFSTYFIKFTFAESKETKR
jgi:hypothetical protein